MLILHLSDIHFRHPMCGGLDPERIYRDELAHHATEQVASLGTVSAIFVTGDIAFRGDPDEYKAAQEWFDDVAAKVGCRAEDVYVVPGNHDVNRAAYGELQVRRTVEGISRETNEAIRERAILATLNDSESAAMLFRPIEAYNAFAAEYDCQIFPGRPYWEKEFPLTDGAALYVRGMTSTFLSGVSGDDTQRGLYLGAMQCGLSPKPGVVNMALTHHPPDWYSDEDTVERLLGGRPNILLFGHKHNQWLTTTADGALFVRAGSVNPERYEAGWSPAYNFLQFTVDSVDVRHAVRVRTWQYDYQTTGSFFRARAHQFDGENLDYFDHRITLNGVWTAASDDRERSDPGSEAVTGEPPDPSDDMEVVVMAAPQARQLNRRFWRLAHSQRRKILVLLDEWPADQAVVDEYADFRAAIIRLVDKQALNMFDEAIGAAEAEEI